MSRRPRPSRRALVGVLTALVLAAAAGTAVGVAANRDDGPGARVAAATDLTPTPTGTTAASESPTAAAPSTHATATKAPRTSATRTTTSPATHTPTTESSPDATAEPTSAPTPAPTSSPTSRPVLDLSHGPVVYDVRIKGTASGNPFALTGRLTFRRTVSAAATENGENPAEACLKVGFPAGAPQPGAIWYGTTSDCWRKAPGAGLDLAQVSFDGNTFSTAPDGRLQASFANTWTARPGTAACIYSPVSGQTTYELRRSGAIAGSVALSGFGGGACGPSTYSATLSGTRA